MPHTHSVSLSIYVATGSRNEKDGEEGVSHYLEHMLFKGSQKRPTAKEISEAIDGVGGVLNAGTDREYTVYYAKVARTHMDMALDVLFDMLRRPLLDEREMEKERQVVLEELAMVADSPAQIADLLLDSILWPDNPLGRDVAGTEESVKGISRGLAFDYLQRQYCPGTVIVAVAGNLEHDELVAQVSSAFADWEAREPSPWLPAPAVNGSRCAVKYKKTEQAHVSVAVPALPLSHPDRHALSYLSVILGEGMSSRLFMELRERRGLVYDVHSYVAHFRDAGSFNVYTGVDPKNAADALKVVLDELSRLRVDGPSGEELTKARELSKGRLMLRMEDTRNVSGWIGGQELLLGSVRSIDDAVAEMDAVTLDDLRRVGREVLDPAGLHVAVVGPYRSDKRFAALI